MKKLICFLLPLFLLCMPVRAGAEEAAVPIYTVEDLLAVGENPSGSYILMADLDLQGVEWPCPDFSGSFDGNGHAIINLFLDRPGATVAKAYDGNRKGYDVECVGLFGVMRNAQVKNLRLINARSLVETDAPCFVGALAGAMYDSTVTDCVVVGELELRAHDRIFGVGGLVGYGNGQILGCSLDVTLICTDTDKKTKDEQFLGGVYATGFIDLIDCTVYIDGYASEFGYAHNGGLVGMYLQYPWGYEETGTIKDNRVEGKITFFEYNDDRRAYCNPFAGEKLVFYEFYKGGNTSAFERDERWEYDKELRPHMCKNPAYYEEVTPPTCTDFGYTTYTCHGCSYSFQTNYTLPQHVMSDWYVTKSPSVEAEGVRESACSGCDYKVQEAIPRLAPPETTAPVQTQPVTRPEPAPTQAEPVTVPEKKADASWLLWTAGGLIAAAVAVLALSGVKKKK